MKFQLFGITHLSIIALTFGISALLIFIVKKFGDKFNLTEKILACLLIAVKLTTLSIAYADGSVSWQNGLPLHLCDWTNIIVIIVLFWRNQFLYELAYYWGLAGTIQALLTPDLRYFFPDPRFITFFVSHSGIIAAVLVLTIGRNMRPSKFSIWKVFAATQFYIIVTLSVNWLLDANYGYLCRKPFNPSLLDHLGPWPYYILSMDALALFSFFICGLPFIKHWLKKA